MRNDLVGNGTWLDLARQRTWRARDRRPPNSCSFVAERRHRRVGPGIHMRAVVGRIHHDRVVVDPKLLDLVENGPTFLS